MTKVIENKLGNIKVKNNQQPTNRIKAVLEVLNRAEIQADRRDITNKYIKKLKTSKLKLNNTSKEIELKRSSIKAMIEEGIKRVKERKKSPIVSPIKSSVKLTP